MHDFGAGRPYDAIPMFRGLDSMNMITESYTWPWTAENAMTLATGGVYLTR